MLSEFIGTAEKPTNGTHTQAQRPEQPKPETESDVPGIAEIFGAASDSESADLSVDSLDGIYDYLENGLNDAISAKEKQSEKEPEKPSEKVTINGNSDPLSGQTVEISVEIYVEILEAITGSLASWYSGDEETDFSFGAKIKERYKKIMAIYAKSQNIEVSPGFLAAAFTILMVGQVGIKAHKQKNKILRAQNFRRQMIEKRIEKAPVKQPTLFDTVEHIETPKTRELEKKAEIPASEYSRKDFKIDERGFYQRNENGIYLKKNERVKKPSPELKVFMDEFYQVHQTYPSNKEVKTFLKHN